MSDDIRNHFKEYDKEKEMLRRQVETHDQGFRDTLLLAEKLVTPIALSEGIRTKVAIAYLDTCRGKGPGIQLETSSESFNWSWHGGSGGGSGKPPEDIVSAFKVLESFQPDAELRNRCSTLAQRANVIIEKAKHLSQNALTLAERIYLYGTCQYLDSKSN